MHQTSLRALAPLSAPLSAPLRAPARPLASSMAGSLTVRSLASASGRAPFSAAASRRPTRPRTGSVLPRPLLPKPLTLGYSSSSRPPVKYEIDRKHEKEVGQQKLERRPDEVSADSSVRHIFEHSQNTEEPPDVSEALGRDVHAVKDAFSLAAVPREAYVLGLSGTIPYFVTSISTVYLGWILRGYQSTSPIKNSFMVGQETAQQWLQMLEPVQLGYGAVIISFIGAVHWGMEIMEKTPNADRTRFRYAMGILAPAVAWPTLVLPVHFALTGQFLAFTMLYFADSRATKLGWAPQWYATYRFMLTAVVGSAILVSLLFRTKIDDAGENMSKRLESGMHQRGPVEENYSAKWARLEKKEKEKIKAEEKKKAEEEKKAKDKGDSGKEGEKANKGESKADKGESKADKGESKDEGEKSESKEDKGEEDAKSGDGEQTQKKGSGEDVKTDGGASSKKKAEKGDEQAKGGGERK